MVLSFAAARPRSPVRPAPFNPSSFLLSPFLSFAQQLSAQCNEQQRRPSEHGAVVGPLVGARAPHAGERAAVERTSGGALVRSSRKPEEQRRLGFSPLADEAAAELLPARRWETTHATAVVTCDRRVR